MTRRLLEHLNHELRSPMTVIVGMSDLLLLSAADPEQKHLLQSVKQASDVMLRMLDEAVDFTRLEAGSLLLEERDFVLAQAIDQAREVLAQGPAPIHLTVLSNPAVPARVVGDAARLQQALEALARSATKLRASRHFDLQVSAEPIPRGIRLHFVLVEHGRSLDAASAHAPDQLLCLADFAQRGYFGSGLALPVVAGLAELMKGELSTAGNPDAPVIFRLAICLGLSDAKAGAGLLAAVERRLRDVSPDVHRLRVLLAEDTTANREFFRTALEQRGHTVVAVEDGREALRAFQAARESSPFDVVLLDVEMPVLDGREAAAELRKLPQLAARPTPLVALTAHQTAGDREFAVNGLFDAAITKPCELTHLYEVIEAVARGETPSAQWGESPAAVSADRVDYRGALRRLDGNEQLFRDLCRFFLEDVPGVLAKLRTALGREDAEGVERAAHSVKGLVANFGAKEAADLAAELQKLGQWRNLTGASSIYQRLEQEVDHLRRELKVYHTPAVS
ncbi:MAG TPA: response regulator [Pirellulales bacterium]|nr:response regulator [Pirellulales bacterium]